MFLPLENTKSAGDFFIDVEHAGGDELPLALQALHLLAGDGAGKIAPDHGASFTPRFSPRGDLARAGERKVPVQEILRSAILACSLS